MMLNLIWIINVNKTVL